jgi:RHS repeat-associated protein
VPCPGGGFTNWIYQLVAEGITGGCTATTYCPHANTTEGQMLVFLGTSPLWPNYGPVAGANIVTTQGNITYCYPTTTHTYRDENDRVISEFQDTRMNRESVYFGNLLVASMTTVWPIQSPYTESRIWEYYASDHLGTPRLVTNSAAQKIDLRKYLPYGDEMNGTGATTQRLRFDSMERDTESNHFYDHARHNDFKLGRFVTVDKHVGGPLRPVSWNKYQYASDNPLLRVDRDGLIDLRTDQEKQVFESRSVLAAAGHVAQFSQFGHTTASSHESGFIVINLPGGGPAATLFTTGKSNVPTPHVNLPEVINGTVTLTGQQALALVHSHLGDVTLPTGVRTNGEKSSDLDKAAAKEADRPNYILDTTTEMLRVDTSGQTTVIMDGEDYADYLKRAAAAYKDQQDCPEGSGSKEGGCKK